VVATQAYIDAVDRLEIPAFRPTGTIRPEQQGERVAATERLGNPGLAEWDLTGGEVLWLDQLYRVYERNCARTADVRRVRGAHRRR
jgi:hypothetical protein